MTDEECTCGRLYTFGAPCPVHANENPVSWEVLGQVEPENPLLALKSVEAVPAQDSEILAIRASQEAFDKVMDELIALYREFDRSRRQAMKDKLKSIRERLVELGATIGISRVSLDSLWAG